MSDYRSLQLDELDPIDVAGVHWRPVRRTLGVEAFGINAYSADAGEEVIESHTELTLGHEEVYVVVSGRATFFLDDATLDAPSGTLVYVSNPAVRRHARAVEAGTTVLAIGGKAGAAYVPSPWEWTFGVERLRESGDYDVGVAELEQALERYPGNAEVIYQLGCWQALAGSHDEAVENVKTAMASDPRYVELAPTDSDLDSVRERLPS